MSSESTATATTTATATSATAAGKLLLHTVENGHTFEFDCKASTPVGAIQRTIEALCRIPFQDQLLICNRTSLDSRQTLGHYQLPQDDREVFLYNKSRLSADSAPPPAEAINIPDPAVPPLPSPHPLDGAANPALQALVSYEQQFRHHFQIANAVHKCTQARFEISNRLLREIQVQERALENTRSKLALNNQKIHRRYRGLVILYGQQRRRRSDLLANIGSDVERLRMTKLHPALQTETHECLMDFAKGVDTHKWAEGCADSMRLLEDKISQLKLVFEDFEKGMENVLSIRVSGGSKDLELMIKENQKNVDDQRYIMQSLSKDVNTVKKLLDDSLDCQMSSSLHPHDAISALGPMYNIHEKNHLPKVQNCDCDISKVLNSCKKKKDEMNHLVHDYIKEVARAENSIKGINFQLHGYREFMESEDKKFENLKFVHGIYPAYRACLAEIVRRKSSLKFYMGLAGQLAEKLAAERMSEVKTREGFLKAWSNYIPRAILASMGLFDSPSQYDINIAPFDTSLLEIDIGDVDRFAPQDPPGLQSEYEGNGASKKCSDASRDSCYLTKSRESSLDICEKYISKGILEGCESVNISGTSKLEVENVYLKSELASAIVLICSLSTEFVSASVDGDKLDSMLKNTAEKMSEALHFKDEYIKHLKAELNAKRAQCLSHENRIQELEQGFPIKEASEHIISELKTYGCKIEICADGDAHMHSLCTEPVDEVSRASLLLDPKLDQITQQSGKHGEGKEDNFLDICHAQNIQVMDSSLCFLDESLPELTQDENQVKIHEYQVGNIDKNQVDAICMDKKMLTPQLHLTATTSCSDDSVGEKNQTAVELSLEPKYKVDLVLDLQNALVDKENQCNKTESKLNASLEEINSLKRELEIIQNRFDEAQMNCAHLENRLHDARAAAHTHLCAADRRASEYSALRTTAVKLRSLFERFRNCVTASVGVATFVESLRSLALSLDSSDNENEVDGIAEFRVCMTVLADKLSVLSGHRAELLDRCAKAEAAREHLVKELEEKKELFRILYSKHQLEKQARKEKISFGRFELHELAAFVLNSYGHYEAINRTCLNYFLSAESVALFTEHLPRRPLYIIGQIVHIEQKIVTPSAPIRAVHDDRMGTLSFDVSSRHPPGLVVKSNPYNLPVGSEYFIVTVAMLPDTNHSSPS